MKEEKTLVFRSAAEKCPVGKNMNKNKVSLARHVCEHHDSIDVPADLIERPIRFIQTNKFTHQNF
jgi:hypothetical protein